jgi:hypothetical protein
LSFTSPQVECCGEPVEHSQQGHLLSYEVGAARIDSNAISQSI